MATQEELKKIAQKSVDDDDFRTALEKDPKQAAASIGITLSPEQVQSIKDNAASAEDAGSRESKNVMVTSIITITHS